MTISEEICSLETKLGYALPESYEALLACQPQALAFHRKGKRWKFPQSSGLLAPVTIGEFNQPYYRQLVAQAANMELESDANLAIEGVDLTLTTRELCNGVAIAGENADVLFLNPKQRFSVWAFYHDGGYVEREADSVLAWLMGSQSEMESVVDPDRETERVRIGIEDGIHFYVRNILVARGKLKQEDFFREEFGNEVWLPDERETLEELTKAVALLGSLDSKQQTERTRVF